MHLLIDGYSNNSKRLRNEGELRHFLESYPERLGLIKLCAPVVLTYNSPNPQDSGISGFVIIAESHLSIHTFPKRNYINIDIFSCKPFDSDRVLKDVEDFFDIHHANSWVINRGLEYYDSKLGSNNVSVENSPDTAGS